MSSPAPLRGLPSVEKVVQALGPLDVPRPAAVAVVRRLLAARRTALTTEGEEAVPPAFDDVVAGVREALDHLRAGRIVPVINATGVLLHTNLGRAPRADAALAAVAEAASGYSNLEFDPLTGERGPRAAYLEHTLALVCGAEAATAVNNCAAALVLMLRAFTARRAEERREVIVSRGELVQIGGGFRIPEILEASGARLREVGTTNRTTLEDYAAAIGPATALVLKVHRSNFYVGGFTGSPLPAEIAALARRRRVPFAEDLGSGALVDTAAFGLGEHERTPPEAIRDGVDAVCFSGDKLLGGPQAGLIAGRARWVRAFKKEPFFRALRCDKLVLAALQATVDLYLAGKAADAVPTLAALRVPLDALHARARTILAALAGVPGLEARATESRARTGGGTLPRAEVPSVAIELRPGAGRSAEALAARLRRGTPPVVGHLSGERLLLDLRTVQPRQDEALAAAVRAAAGAEREA